MTHLYPVSSTRTLDHQPPTNQSRRPRTKPPASIAFSRINPKAQQGIPALDIPYAGKDMHHSPRSERRPKKPHAQLTIRLYRARKASSATPANSQNPSTQTPRPEPPWALRTSPHETPEKRAPLTSLLGWGPSSNASHMPSNFTTVFWCRARSGELAAKRAVCLEAGEGHSASDCSSQGESRGAGTRTTPASTAVAISRPGYHLERHPAAATSSHREAITQSRELRRRSSWCRSSEQGHGHDRVAST